jgi:hypothetical protein
MPNNDRIAGLLAAFVVVTFVGAAVFCALDPRSVRDVRALGIVPRAGLTYLCLDVDGHPSMVGVAPGGSASISTELAGPHRVVASVCTPQQVEQMARQFAAKRSAP